MNPGSVMEAILGGVVALVVLAVILSGSCGSGSSVYLVDAKGRCIELSNGFPFAYGLVKKEVTAAKCQPNGGR